MHSKDKKKVEIYEMMCKLIDAENNCRDRTRQSEEEVSSKLRLGFSYFVTLPSDHC